MVKLILYYSSLSGEGLNNAFPAYLHSKYKGVTTKSQEVMQTFF